MRVALSALAASVALLAGEVSSAAAAPAATAASTNTCWRDVVNDWLSHHGQVVGTYAIPCYTQAIQHLNAYVDVQSYSTATDDIRRALLAVLHRDRGPGGPGSGLGGVGPIGGPTDGGKNSGKKSSGDRGVLGMISPSSAQSVPLPLLVLGGLALLLLAAAGATLVAKRVQTRRGRPVPPRTPAVDKRS
jgi:hypothetical protein